MPKSTGAQRKSAETETAESEAVQKPNPPTKFEVVKDDKDKEPDKKKPDYPEGTKLFSYTPKGGGKPIQFPTEFEKPDKLWLWELTQLPFLSQTFAWMDRAGVPKEIQRVAVSLPDDEYPELFTSWFKAMGGGATPGE